MQMTLGEIPLEEMKEVWYGEGFGEGFEEGEAKGMSKGISQGISQGRLEGITQEKDLRVRKYLMLHNNPQEAATLFELPLDNVIAISKELGR